jgi:hypothetical protein
MGFGLEAPCEKGGVRYDDGHGARGGWWGGMCSAKQGVGSGGQDASAMHCRDGVGPTSGPAILGPAR